MLAIWCDGLCEPVNPGGWMCWAFFVRDLETGQIVHMAQGCFDRKDAWTNNLAEYAAVTKALEWCVAHEQTDLPIYTDSQLVVKQLTGEWGCWQDLLVKAHTKALGLSNQVGAHLTWVPRLENMVADTMTRAAYKARTGRDAPVRSKPPKREAA